MVCRAQPDGHRDRRLRWALLGAAGADRGRRSSARRRALSLFVVGGLAYFRRVEPRFADVDLMATAIAVEELGKRYRLGELRAALRTLRDALARSARRVGCRASRASRARRSGRCATSSFEVERGRGRSASSAATARARARC